MKYGYIFLCIFFLLITCSKEQPGSRTYPRVTTHAVSKISTSGALFEGEVTYPGTDITDHGFLWSAFENPTFDNSDTFSLGAQPAGGIFSTSVNRALLPNLKYYLRAYARSGDYLVYGDIVSFMSMGSESPYSLICAEPLEHLMPRKVVTVLGNFSPDVQVKIDGKPVSPGNITSIASRQFNLKLPDSVRQGGSLSVIVSGKEVTSNYKLSMTLSYKSKNQKSFSTRMSKSFSCVIGGKDYFGFGLNSNYLTDSLFSYDPVTDVVAAINQTTISKRFLPMSFSIGGLGYFGGGQGLNGGLTDFYSFDPSTGTITRLTDLPTPDGTNSAGYNENHTVAGFEINGQGYCFVYTKSPAGETNKLYQFHPDTNTWTPTAQYPGTVNSAEFFFIYSFFFVQQGTAYLGGLNNLWSYDPSVDRWAAVSTGFHVQDYPYSYTLQVLKANDNVYLMSLEEDPGINTYITRYYEFSPETRKLNATPFSTSLRFNSLNGAFSLGGTSYFYSGSTVWEFDPNR